jgi:hypothetical protein
VEGKPLLYGKKPSAAHSRITEDKAVSLAFFTDPDGNPLYLAEMKPAYKDRVAAAPAR